MLRLKELLNHFLSIFFPFRCHACKNVSDFGKVLCDDCIEKLRKTIHKPQEVKDTVSDFPIYTMSSYDDFTSDLVKIIKYKPSKKLAIILGKVCAEQAELKDFINVDDVIIPVPMHEKRLEERGFNQASVLAETYAKKVGCNFSPVIIRSRYTKPQASCDESERTTNLDKAFTLSPDIIESAFNGKRLIVVDDVATTGTTLQKSVEPLKALKAKEIIALVVAHSYKKIQTNNKNNKNQQQ